MKTEKCPKCRSGMTCTSASPGDGRRKWVCPRCGHWFTRGKPAGTGYQPKG